MPANSGALTGTIAHKHSALSADGGFLDDGVTGVTGTANGSLLMFDGSSIAQDLPSGNLNDVLTMGAAVPAWSTPAVASSAYEKVAEATLGVTGPTLTCSFAAVNAADISELVVYFNGQVNSTDMMITVNSHTASNYTLNGLFSFATTGSNPINVIEGPIGFWRINSSSIGIDKFIVCHLNCNLVSDTIQMTSLSAGSAGWESVAGFLDSPYTSLSSVTFYQTTGNMQAGSKITVFKVVN